jgi:hypothetical protein
MKPQPKICVQCAWITDATTRHPICEHPDAPRDLVRGLPSQTCERERESNSLSTHCGTEGRGFSPLRHVGQAAVDGFTKTVEGV